MITIKTLWLYAAIISSLLVGAGATYVVIPNASDLKRELKLAMEQIEETQRECSSNSGREKFYDAPVTNSPSKGF